MELSRGTRLLWLTPAAGLVCLLTVPPARAGNLTQCDLARVTAHNAILSIYGPVFAELDAKIADARAKNLDPTDLAYIDADSKVRRVNIVSLRSDLQTQEAEDTSQADRNVARGCDDPTTSPQEIARAAEDMATRGIATVLPKHMVFQGL